MLTVYKIHYVPTDCRIRIESIPFPVRTILVTDYRGIARYQDWIMYGKGDEPGLRAIGK